jgi:hypothetical protein
VKFDPLNRWSQVQCSVKDPSVLIRGFAQSSWGPMSKCILDFASGRIKWRMEKHSNLHHPTCCSLEYFQQYLVYFLTLDHRVLCAENTYSVAHWSRISYYCQIFFLIDRLPLMNAFVIINEWLQEPVGVPLGDQKVKSTCFAMKVFTSSSLRWKPGTCTTNTTGSSPEFSSLWHHKIA